MTAQHITVEGVSGRYATALFELALESKALDQMSKDLDTLQEMLTVSSDLTRLVRSPVFSAEDQSRAIAAVVDKAGIKGLTANFIGLVAKNRRLFAVTDMIRDYRLLLAAHRGEVAAEVTSAEKLTAVQVKALKTALKDKVGQDVQLDAHVDPSLLGGLVVKLGSRMIDTSLKTKLNNLKLAMKEVG